MKKLISAVIALAMLFSFALAEGTDTVYNVNFEEVVPEETRAGGDYIHLAEDQQLQVWIPSPETAQFVETEIDETSAQLGVFLALTYYAGTDQDAIAFMRNQIDGTFEELVAVLKEDSSISEVDLGLVNGINAVSYRATTDQGDYMYVTYELDGEILSVFFPVTENEEFLAWAKTIVISVSRYDDAEG